MSSQTIEGQESARLRARHAKLEDALLAEESKLQPDDLAIAEIKKQKLRLKDELARITPH
jgi:hypothetical protein